jgi:hypothetical protein
VLTRVSDGLTRGTTLVVLNAEDLAAGPLAEIPTPLSPTASHGDGEGVVVG